MNRRLFATILALAIVPAANSAPAPKSGDEDGAPYKAAKVGDYATYKMTVAVAGTNIDGSMTQTIAARTDKELTIKTMSRMTANGMALPASEQQSTIDLTKPIDPVQATLMGLGGPAGGPVPKVEKIKEGKEKVKVAGKEYEATWTTFKVNLNAGVGQPMDAEMKVWTSGKFSMYTLKVEMTTDVAGMKMQMTMELTESGTKDK